MGPTEEPEKSVKIEITKNKISETYTHHGLGYLTLMSPLKNPQEKLYRSELFEMTKCIVSC